MGLEITGIEENASAVDEYIANLQEQLNARIGEVVQSAYDQMVNDSPVDTGNLQSSWDLQLSETGWEITNDADYCGFVEFGHSTRGTSFVPGQNWITPAYEQMRSDLEDVIKEFSS
jgi:hypothetical protein